jgi:hypothetical protein
MLDQFIEELTDAAKQMGADPRHVEVLVVGLENDPDDQCAYEVDFGIRCVRAHGLQIRLETDELGGTE